MKRVTQFIFIVLLIQITGCANYMYQGELMATDSANQSRKVILYWPKTDPLIGEVKAGPAMLLTECGIPIMFQQQPEGIIFRGSSADDRLPGQAPGSLQDGNECGRFVDQSELKAISDGPLLVKVLCEPISDDFSVVDRTYLKAHDEPYEFDISETKEWTLLGSTPNAPEPPLCSD